MQSIAQPPQDETTHPGPRPIRVAQPAGFTWTDEDRALLKSVTKDVSDAELAVFQMMCDRTGLDPFLKQIYAIKRSDKGEKKLTIQTSIDGFRLIADRTGQYAGNSEPTYDTETAEHPGWAKVTVFKLVGGHLAPFTAKVRWEEFYPKVHSAFWDRMPYHMLAKVGESHALRKAFPQELSGLYIHEEMQQADTVVAGASRPALYEDTHVDAPKPPLVRTADPLEVQREAMKLEIRVALSEVVRPLRHAGLYKAVIFHCFHCAWDVLAEQSLETLTQGIGLFRHLCAELEAHGMPTMHPDQWIGQAVLRLTSPQQEEDAPDVQEEEQGADETVLVA
jgi:phage recombination protein Bet